MTVSKDNQEWKDRARSRMKELGVTQAALSAAIGAQPARLGHYLTGRNEPPLAHFMLICRHLQVSADWLLFGGANSPLQVPSPPEGIARQLRDLDASTRRDIEGYIRIKQAAQ